jgi:PHD/YefM family antitoxin component YafN of YafNO toxin-antitoxin module
MKTYNAATFKRNMLKTFDHCEESKQPVRIKTIKNHRIQQIIIIEKSQFDIMIDKIKGVK